ncbi:hypothetical protein ACS0TY_011800 [Phlomoides rotata]
MPITLTEGAIAVLSGDDAQNSDIKPVLQVADIRLVNTARTQSDNERYRILLSDGSFTQQGMLATQRNYLVHTEKLQKGSIVQLTQFVCNIIQNRRIIIIIDLDVIVEKCDLIGEPKQFPIKTDGNVSSGASAPTPVQPMNQPAGGGGGGGGGRPPSYSVGSRGNPTAGAIISDSVPRPNVPPIYPQTGAVSGVPRAPVNNYVRPPQTSYNQPPPMFANRGPIAKNEAPPRIIPIAGLNPYQGRWTIKARVTLKSELRRYSNNRGEGKVFSFDLLDSNGGEIRATCFNATADQFYHVIEPGRVYLISKGVLKPAQKNFNHLRNDHEIMLDTSSTVQPCFEDDTSIPQQQFNFRPISDIEVLDNNSIIDVIGVVSSISPSSSLMRKNGTETQKRTLQLKDMSGRSVELTLWGNFCNSEGQTLQNVCDSGVFPVLAVKSARVSEFSGKSVGTISTSQLFIEPDFPEAQKLKTWFDREGKNCPVVSISKEASIVRTDVRKTISQIKDEKLGTSEKPDWITILATLTFIKGDNFCYTACPLMIGDRQCNKKVTNNGDGKWRCERCDQLIDECDYRYILQIQIQDHTGISWATAFQESGEEIMGVSAKDLYYMKHEEQDDEKFTEVVRNVLFTKFLFKLKVKEEIFSDEQRVKSTVVKAEKVNFPAETRFLLDSIAKLKQEDPDSVQPKTESLISTSGLSTGGFGGSREPAAPAMNYSGINSNVKQEDPDSVQPKTESLISTSGLSTGGFGGGREPAAAAMNYSGINSNVTGESRATPMNSYGNQYGGSKLSSSSGMYTSCGSCGGTGHNSANCPSLMSGPAESYASSFGGGASGECFKCHQVGHWARDCPGVSNAPPAYGSNPGRYGMAPKQHIGGF